MFRYTREDAARGSGVLRVRSRAELVREVRRASPDERVGSLRVQPTVLLSSSSVLGDATSTSHKFHGEFRR